MSADASTTAAGAATPTQSVVIVTITSQQDNSGSTLAPVVVTQYSTSEYTASAARASTTTASASATAVASAAHKSTGGLGTGGIVGIAVGVGAVAIALLALLGFLIWRNKKRQREDLAQRKEEQDQYAFHPSDAGAVAPLSFTQNGEKGAYRGWQPTNVTRQPSGSMAVGGLFARNNYGAAGVAGPALRNSTSGETALEDPTLPAIHYDSDSETGSPQQLYTSATQPGNGSPPLDAMNAGSPSSEYSPNLQHGSTTDRFAPASRNQRMSSFMPALQPGYQHRPSYGQTYSNF